VNHLRRELAPLTDAAWEQICDESARAAKLALAARKLFDLAGPHGWTYSAVELGHRDDLDRGPAAGVEAAQRRVLPLVELRTPFELDLAALDDADRGAQDLDLDRVTEAATRAAVAEDTVVFHGFDAAGIEGIGRVSPHDPVAITDDYEKYPAHVAEAVSTLRAAGVDGPYGVALGPRCYTGVIESTEDGGYPVFRHIHQIVDGPIVRAPAVDGAFVVSLRGGDYELVVGQDLSLGYRSHDETSVRLYFEESLAFRVNSPEAGVRLVYPS
jgi:uncharacterized linocin/CFP29 family protein